MEITKESLEEASKETGFTEKNIEKAWHLMRLLDIIKHNEVLGSRFALKGGTGLNLFYFGLPRLSVDIDLNYIASAEREVMLQERPLVETVMEEIFKQEQLVVRRKGGEYAAVKYKLEYKSVVYKKGEIDVDLNYVCRTPIWKAKRLSSTFLGKHRIEGIPVLDFHEISAGKLAALLTRGAMRDFFDAHYFLTQMPYEKEKLRLAFIVYLTMSLVPDPFTLSSANLVFNRLDFKQQVLPVLRKGELRELGPSAAA